MHFFDLNSTAIEEDILEYVESTSNSTTLLPRCY